LIVLAYVLVSSDPPSVLFFLFMIYAVSGYLLWAWRHLRTSRAGRAKSPDSPN
jgi:CDP-diacylglycerol--serine O-phosphatidyltransferase